MELHICGITNDGKLWHTSRDLDDATASWSPWQEVETTEENAPGPFVRVDCASLAGINPNLHFEDLHVLGVTGDGKLWHTSLVTEDLWQPFEDLTARIGGNGGGFQDVGVTELIGEGGQALHVCVVVQTQPGERRMLHTVRSANGTWDSFEDVTDPQLAGLPGAFVSVDCAGLGELNVNGNKFVSGLEELHVCGVTEDGKLWHTIHFSDPPWLPFVNVQVLSANAPDTFATVSTAETGGNLHVCAQAGGEIWHTSRVSADPFLGQAPGWQASFDRVEEQAGRPGSFGSVSCANVDGHLHICGVTGDGKLWHTSRDSESASWQAFEEVTAAIATPGSFQYVSAAGLIPVPPPIVIPEGQDPTCPRIRKSIANDNATIQGLQRQKAGVTNSAALAHINAQIARLQQGISALQQQAQQHHCP
jgi:hypothetical protein